MARQGVEWEFTLLETSFAWTDCAAKSLPCFRLQGFADQSGEGGETHDLRM